MRPEARTAIQAALKLAHALEGPSGPAIAALLDLALCLEAGEPTPSQAGALTGAERQRRHRQRQRDRNGEPSPVTSRVTETVTKSDAEVTAVTGAASRVGGVGGGLDLRLQAPEITANSSSERSKTSTSEATETAPSSVTRVTDSVTDRVTARDVTERPSDRDLEAQAVFEQRRQDALRRAKEFGRELESESREETRT